MEKEFVRKYWREVIQRSFKPVWEEMTMRVVIVALGLLLLSVAISGFLLMLGFIPNDFFANRVEEAQAGLAAFGLSVAVCVVLFIRGIYKTPVQMHEELGGFIENPFLLDVYRSRRERKADEDKWASIVVKNVSVSENIEDCFLRLEDIIDLKTKKSIIEDVQNLAWSD